MSNQGGKATGDNVAFAGQLHSLYDEGENLRKVGIDGFMTVLDQRDSEVWAKNVWLSVGSFLQKIKESKFVSQEIKNTVFSIIDEENEAQKSSNWTWTERVFNFLRWGFKCVLNDLVEVGNRQVTQNVDFEKKDVGISKDIYVNTSLRAVVLTKFIEDLKAGQYIGFSIVGYSPADNTVVVSNASNVSNAKADLIDAAFAAVGNAQVFEGIKEASPMDVNVCSRCKDFSVCRVDSEKGLVGGVCQKHNYSTNGNGTCCDFNVNVRG